jgi:hypothetical protein
LTGHYATEWGRSDALVKHLIDSKAFTQKEIVSMYLSLYRDWLADHFGGDVLRANQAIVSCLQSDKVTGKTHLDSFVFKQAVCQAWREHPEAVLDLQHDVFAGKNAYSMVGRTGLPRPGRDLLLAEYQKIYSPLSS